MKLLPNTCVAFMSNIGFSSFFSSPVMLSTKTNPYNIEYEVC